MKFDNLSCGIFFHEVTKCGKTKWKKNSTSCKFHKDAISGRARMCEFQKYAISGRACMCEFHKLTCGKTKNSIGARLVPITIPIICLKNSS